MLKPMAFTSDELSPIKLTDTRGKRKTAELKGGKNFAPIVEESEEDMKSERNSGRILGNTPTKPRKSLINRPYKKDELTTSSLLKMIPPVEMPKLTTKKNLTAVMSDSASFKREVVTDLLTKINKELKSDEVAGTPTLSGWPKEDKVGPKTKEKLTKGDAIKVFDKNKVGQAIQNIIDQAKTVADDRKEAASSKAAPPVKKIEAMRAAFVSKEDKPKKHNLNMKDFVDIYKSLSYGSKDEIKTLLENLPLTKNHDEIDKEKLPEVNLNALEKKIKKLEKGSSKSKTRDSETSNTSQNRSKRNSKTDNLIKKKGNKHPCNRNKVIKIPATIDFSFSPKPTADRDIVLNRRKKKMEEREPWKYVGQKSTLDDKYIVYPIQKKNRKKVVKKTAKAHQEDNENQVTSTLLPKPPENFVEKNKKLASIDTKSSIGSMSRVSATSVCDLQFRPLYEHGVSYSDSTTHPFLLYLHNRKAINVKSPLKHEQFARVKLFRNCGLDDRVPLIRGLTFNPHLSDHGNELSIHNVRVPDEIILARKQQQYYDAFDFDDDIKDINEFLLSQERQTQPQRTRPPSLQPSQPLKERFKLRGSARKSHDDPVQRIRDPETRLEKQNMVMNFFNDLDSKIEAHSSEYMVKQNWHKNLIPALCF